MHEIKVCPSCGVSFECKSGSITICQCSQVMLDSNTKDALAKQYDDCLCKECLALVMQQANRSCKH